MAAGWGDWPVLIDGTKTLLTLAIIACEILCTGFPPKEIDIATSGHVAK
jgi:hypothetical protein